MKIPGWLLCWKLKGWRLVRKHRRGVLVPRNEFANQGWQTFRCGRCGAQWTRKARKAKP